MIALGKAWKGRTCWWGSETLWWDPVGASPTRSKP